MTEIEPFDVSFFEPMRTQNQDDIAAISSQINEFHDNPNFIISLLKAFELEFPDEFYLKQTIFALKNDISRNWRSQDFWDFEFREQLIQKLFEILIHLPTPMWDHFVLCFEPICKKSVINDANFTPQILQTFLNILEQNEDLNQIYYFINILLFFLKTEYEKPERRYEILQHDFDELLSTIISKILEKSQAIIDQLNNNTSNAIFLGLLTKICSFYLKISAVAVSNIEFSSAIFELFIKILENVQEDCPERNYLIMSIFKLFRDSISQFIGHVKKAVAQLESRAAFSDYYKENIFPKILQKTYSFLEGNHSPEIMSVLTYIVYQIIFFKLDESIVNDSLFNFLIEQSILSEDSADDAINNPLIFQEQQMNVEILSSKSIPRNSTASIIRILLGKKYEIDFETIFNYLTIDPNSDDVPHIDAKIFLLTALCYKFLRKERKAMEEEEDSIKVPLPEEYCEFIQNIITNEDCPYLVIDALHLYTKFVPSNDPVHGVEFAFMLLSADDLNPLFVTYTAKLFNASVKNDSFDEEDLAQIEIQDSHIEALLLAYVNYPSRSIIKMLKTLANKCKESMHSMITNILSYLCENDSIEQLDPEDLSHLFQLIDTLIASVDDDADLLSNYFEVVQSLLLNSIKIASSFENTGNQFPYQDYFDLLSEFTMNIPQHPEQLYQLFIEIYTVYQENPNILLDIIQTNSVAPFIQTIYPLIADESIGDDEALKDSFKTTLLMLAEQINGNKLDEKESGAEGYILLGMAAFIQRYGIGEETENFFNFAIETIQKILHNQDNDDVEERKQNHDPQYVNIQGCIIFLSSLSRVDPTYEGFAALVQTEEILQFLLSVINKKYLDGLSLLKMGAYLLLNLSRNGVTQCFDSAVKLIKPITELENDDDDDEEGADEEDVEEEEKEEEEESDAEDEENIVFDYDLLIENEKISPLFIQIKEENPDIVNVIDDEEVKEQLSNYLEEWQQNSQKQI